MDRNSNRIANGNHETNADVRSRNNGGHTRRGLRREARSRNKAARRANALWDLKNSVV
jgi:hypothetical protein